MKDNETRKQQFLAELTELTRKHGISIGGCGCCGSPWLNLNAQVGDIRSGYSMCEGDQLRWIEPSDEWYWERYHELIGR